MNKWIPKLRKEEIWEMHKHTVCDILRKKFEIEDKKEGLFNFYEGGWECDGKTEYLKTMYRYSDFDCPKCFDATMPDGCKERFYKWMITRFGNEYLAELISVKTGIELEFIKERIK